MPFCGLLPAAGGIIWVSGQDRRVPVLAVKTDSRLVLVLPNT
jgi:hypothetical protein